MFLFISTYTLSRAPFEKGFLEKTFGLPITFHPITTCRGRRLKPAGLTFWPVPSKRSGGWRWKACGSPWHHPGPAWGQPYGPAATWGVIVTSSGCCPVARHSPNCAHLTCAWGEALRKSNWNRWARFAEVFIKQRHLPCLAREKYYWAEFFHVIWSGNFLLTFCMAHKGGRLLMPSEIAYKYTK